MSGGANQIVAWFMIFYVKAYVFYCVYVVQKIFGTTIDT